MKNGEKKYKVMVNKTILDLSCKEARKFFIKQESYINFDLPPYFKFSKLLNNIINELEKNFTNETIKAKDIEGVNYKILNNKDGKYAWRPFQIINPVIYSLLVLEITDKKNWKIIKDRFKFFKNSNVVECASIPTASNNKKSNKANQILNWWENIEQKSLSLGLDYEYIFDVDITDCYGSIYTHTISWALHNKPIAKIDRSHKLIGNKIDEYIRSMSSGQTNGIPQGSILMDFIAEMVIGYADFLLTDKIKKIDENEYKIIRYRDDYKIFVNNPKIAEEILKSLTEVLGDLNLKINTQKIKQTNDIVEGSIKVDKIYNIVNDSHSDRLQDELIIISNISKQFPNSGTIKKRLDIFDKSLKKENIKKENVIVLISILINIALINPSCYPIISSILSKFIVLIDDEKEKISIINKIINKFKIIPNTGYLEIWLQRISIKINNSNKYSEKLCNVVDGKLNSCDIWNNSWINDKKILSIINSSCFIDKNKIKQLNAVINNNEVSLLSKKY